MNDDDITYLLCTHIIEDIDFKSEKKIERACRGSAFNLIERDTKHFLKCTHCGNEVELK